nr:PREDICTED: uncharacterized protein LOC107397920 [Tribolium castaneum]|eukprot:XP_015835428.1 PREDICTED: uncharacterized protein LOC107397920 [Tribolium castaneum]
MNYKKQFAKDDRLKTLKLMASDVFQSKTVKIILTVVFLVHFIANSLTIYFVLYVFETKLFINYASVFFSEFYVSISCIKQPKNAKFQPMLAILTIIFKGDVVQNLTDEITFWTIDSASKNLQHEIKLKIKFLTAFVIINSFTVVMGSFSYVQQLSDDVNLFLAIRLIRDYFPNYSTILEFFYRMTYPICGYLMAVHAYQCLYYTQHINFQLQMFTEVITELNNSKTSSLLENHLFYNRTYQTNTEQRLKFCIKRSQEFIKICVTKNKEIGSLIPGFAICGLFLGIGITFFLSTGTFTTEYYLRMGVTSICGATTFSALIWSAQTTETMVKKRKSETRMTYPICAYLMAVHAYQCLYYTQHINFQLQMFTEIITELTDLKTISLPENRLFYNKKYQTVIEQRLKFCIKRSQEFIKVCVTKNKEIGSLIPGFAICGLFLGIGITFFLSTGKFTTEYYLRMGVTSICGLTTFSALIWSAQTTETMINDLVMVINKVSWYNFNQSNKKLYLTFLLNTMKERKIKFTEKYSVNYQLGLAIVRGIYSVISVVASKRHH